MTLCDPIAFDRWLNDLGDPGFLPWVTMVLYLAAGWQAARVAMDRRTDLRWFWAFAAVLMIGLAFNKQLDLQTLALHCGRIIAERQGWAAYRRIVEQAAALLVVGTAIAILAGIIRQFARFGAAARTALVGILLALCFLVFRSGTILHLLALERVTRSIAQSLLELSAGALILGGAWRERRTRPPSVPDNRSKS